jgi:hypothetical protein
MVVVLHSMYSYRHRPGSSRRLSTAVTMEFVAVHLGVMVTSSRFSAHISCSHPSRRRASNPAATRTDDTSLSMVKYVHD